MCKQEQPQVFMTRFMGDYTARLSSEQFADLKNRANRGELYYLPDIEGFFDDPKHFAQLKALCGYTHPAISDRCREQGLDMPLFTSLPGMKKFAESKLKLQFCDICVAGRKVFLCEQLLYSRPDLDKHNKSGDDTGPLAEANFKGHPLCKFCKQRFYDSNDLYKHMESAHEHCFLCRRDHPGQYVYYRHYKELEEHFQNDHHLCPHPTCLDKKFVVFASEHELKRHFAGEHGDELKMSRAQRREALTIPINLQYGAGGSTGADMYDAGPSLAGLARPGVVIGGGHGVSSRHGRGGAAASAMRHSRSESAMAAALAASAGVPLDGNVSSVTFTADDFPAVAGGPGGGAGGPGTWRGAAGPGTSGGTSMHHSGSTPLLSDEHFPALPVQSKAAKKKAKQQAGSLADQLRAQNRPVRVINRQTPGASTSSAAASGAGPSAPPPVASDFPALSLGGPAARAPTPPPPPPPPSEPAFVASPARAPPTASSILLSEPSPARATVAPPASTSAPSLADDFPSLPSASAAPAATSGPPPPMAPRYTMLAAKAAGTSSAAAAPAGPVRSPSPPPMRPEDFPSLGQVAVAQRAATHASASSSAATPKASSRAASARAAAPSPAPTITAAAASAVPQGGVSESLKAANRALIDKIKAQLADDSRFSQFRGDSARFMRGEMSATDYHAHMVDLGLLGVAAELASLCPNPDRRTALMEAHKAYLAAPGALSTPPKGGARAGWVPPEAAIAAARAAEEQPSWACASCTLLNAPQAAHCEACGAPRNGPGGGGDAFPSLSSAYGSSSAPSTSSSQQQGGGLGEVAGLKGKKVKGGTKITIGLGAGTARQVAAIQAANPAPNAWGTTNSQQVRQQVEATRQAMAAQAAGRGSWSASGGAKLAKQIGAINDAWDRR